MIKKYFTASLFLVSSLILIYTLYKSEIHWNGSKRDYYDDYYILSLILFIFSTLTFFMNEEVKVYVAITLFSIIFSLYLFQAYLTVPLVYKTISKMSATKSTVLVPPVHYLSKKNIDLFPLSGESNILTYDCNENGYWSSFKTDRYGFNNPDEEWAQTEIRYLMLGDSFVQGACVNRPHDIGSVLRTLSNKSVLNLAYAGNGPLLNFATFKEYSSKRKIKNILWFYTEENDNNGLILELQNHILIKYFNDQTFSQKLIQKQNIINNLTISEIKKEFINFIKLFKARRLLTHRAFLKLPESKSQVVPEFKKILEHMKKLSEENNANFYFVYLPEFFRYSIKNYDLSYSLNIKDIVKNLEITLIDIDKEVFQKEKDPLKLFPSQSNNVHYTVEGYKKVAEVIYRLTKK